MEIYRDTGRYYTRVKIYRDTERYYTRVDIYRDTWRYIEIQEDIILD